MLSWVGFGMCEMDEAEGMETNLEEEFQEQSEVVEKWSGRFGQWTVIKVHFRL